MDRTLDKENMGKGRTKMAKIRKEMKKLIVKSHLQELKMKNRLMKKNSMYKKIIDP